MKIFVSYIKTNVLWVVFCAVLILFQMVFMRLSGMKQNDCIYGIILESMVFIVVFFIGFILSNIISLKEHQCLTLMSNRICLRLQTA